MRTSTNNLYRLVVGLTVLVSMPLWCAAEARASSFPSGIIVYSENPEFHIGAKAPAPPRLYMRRLGDARAIQLMDGQSSQVLFNDFQDLSFDREGKLVAFLCSARTHAPDGKGRSLWVLDLGTRKLRSVASGVDTYQWSPSKSQILFHVAAKNHDAYAIYNLPTNTSKPLFRSSDLIGEVAWANGGKDIVFQERNRSIKERNLQTFRDTTRWRSRKEVGVDLYPSPYDNSLIICTYGKNYCFWKNRSKAWTFETGDFVPHGIVWSPDANRIAIQCFSYFPSSEGNTDLPTGTDQSIYTLDSRNGKIRFDNLRWTDDVGPPYRYQIVGWSGGHKSLLLLNSGNHQDAYSKGEKLISLDMQTHAKTELMRLDVAIGSIAWHETATGHTSPQPLSSTGF